MDRKVQAAGVLREGTYAINLAQFVVITEEKVYNLSINRDDDAIVRGMAQVIADRNGFRPVIIKDTDDLVGIVTVHDGPSLAQGEIIAPVVGDDASQPTLYHNKFQDADAFCEPLLATATRQRSKYRTSACPFVCY